MVLSCVPPVAASLIATTENILHIAPVSRGWKAEAPANIVFLSPSLTQQALLIQIALLRPTTIIAGDQAIDAQVIGQWRTSRPFGELCLVRRGTSLDKVRLDLCESNGIQVINTPGVNAPHVAAYIAHWLTLADGSLPHDICVLGYGNVGKELVKLLLDRDPAVRIRVLERQGRTTDFPDRRVSFETDGFEVLEGARAVALCVSLNDESVHRIDRALIERLHARARLVCVAKPDVFSDDALRTLAAAEEIQLVLDYGPATLDAFRMRIQALGCDVASWRKPPTLTTRAATTEACHGDLDYAVCVQLSLMALRGLVRRKLAQSLTIPTHPVDVDAPRVSVIGRGINGLLQAVMLRLANYRVAVYAGNRQSDGASHKQVNMRHLSATETTAKPLHNDYLFPANQHLSVECNRAGIELFEKLLADNPSLARFARARIVRAYREDAGDVEAAIREQREIENRPWPSGRAGGEFAEISRMQSQARYAIPGIGRAIEVSGYDLELIHFMHELEALLQRGGVQFVPGHLSPAEIAELSREHVTIECTRPGTSDGLSIVYWSAYHQVTAGGTYAGGTTQGLVWASLVQELIQTRTHAP